MSCELVVKGEAEYRLAGELCVFHAAILKPQLLELLKLNAAEIDLGEVEEVDTAGLQLLLLVKREASRAARELRFVNHSQAVLDAIALLNLSADFGDPLLIPAKRKPEANHEPR